MIQTTAQVPQDIRDILGKPELNQQDQQEIQRFLLHTASLGQSIDGFVETIKTLFGNETLDKFWNPTAQALAKEAFDKFTKKVDSTEDLGSLRDFGKMSPEQLKNLLYNFTKEEARGWRMKPDGKVGLAKEGRSWIKQMSYILTRQGIDHQPFIQRCYDVFDPKEVFVLHQSLQKTVQRGREVRQKEVSESKQVTVVGSQDQDVLSLLRYASSMTHKDIPGVTGFDKQKMLSEVSLNWFRDKIRRFLQRDVFSLNSFILRASSMFKDQFQFVFSQAFRNEVNSLLPNYHGKTDLLMDFLNKPLVKKPRTSFNSPPLDNGKRIVRRGSNSQTVGPRALMASSPSMAMSGRIITHQNLHDSRRMPGLSSSMRMKSQGPPGPPCPLMGLPRAPGFPSQFSSPIVPLMNARLASAPGFRPAANVLHQDIQAGQRPFARPSGSDDFQHPNVGFNKRFSGCLDESLPLEHQPSGRRRLPLMSFQPPPPPPPALNSARRPLLSHSTRRTLMVDETSFALDDVDNGLIRRFDRNDVDRSTSTSTSSTLNQMIANDQLKSAVNFDVNKVDVSQLVALAFKAGYNAARTGGMTDQEPSDDGLASEGRQPDEKDWPDNWHFNN